ncbi:rRNA pseudouridine synthase [Massilia niastensis]|uniref:rRNA pseudouridine synthase n=1 Tax=Massilia niastensis TaxID=544911 RepID=UPI000367501A|nr:rRNA pseudouridine synthase [Massilia niastensis]
MTDDSIRLAKRVAEVKGCSRAEAERYIAGGWVSVDGAVADDPAIRVTPAQLVALLPGATPVEPPPVTILLHKPAGIDADAALASLGAETLEQEDGRGKRFLKRHLARLVAAAPLEPEASGLVVFTQDWRVARKLVEDGARIEHEYVVEVEGEIQADGLEKLNRQFKASWQNETRLRLAGKNIQPGQIAILCAGVGLQVRSIRRLRVGRMSMGGLPSGRWRYLHDTERF